MRVLVFFLILQGVLFRAYGQKNSNNRAKYAMDSSGLVQLMNISERNDAERQKRVNQYVLQSRQPQRYSDGDGQLMVMVDVTDSGIPIYESVHNAAAAATTGVVSLRASGGVGLDLRGSGITVGIWDEGLVGHNEFQGRILYQEGTPSVHANHVTGTILASGNNILAQGMAPLASALTFDFTNDESEILQYLTPGTNSLLFSNHSYGLVTGWRLNTANNTWQWFGDPSVSSQEDYRFGFYSANASFWDQMAFNSPYLTIVKSAGNDRTDTGNGTRPPDCNGGTGYDCIGDFATCKNVITVGATLKVPNYVDNSSVFMSTFSSWGPTDDGRIKPDFVAAGVSLFSTSTNDGYTSLSGTSMATPNATGSLMLLQELYKKVNGVPMRASTLKALAIHSVKEAGSAPGPDYKFGWGLLDVKKGAELIIANGSNGTLIQELSLLQGNTFEVSINPKENTKVTATIVWTDPAGTPVSASLDPVNTMLVNDLDIKITDETDTQLLPWVLDPAFPDSPAAKGNNNRDNVEKIEFFAPFPKPYRLVVSHKGQLRNGNQDFSLIITHTPENEVGETFYYLGKTSNFNSPENWSLTSGGPSGSGLPGPNDRVFVDTNTEHPEGEKLLVELTDDFACRSLIWLAPFHSKFNFNGHHIEIHKDLIFSGGGVEALEEGSIRVIGEEGVVDLNGNTFSGINLIFDNPNGEWRFRKGGHIELLEQLNGNLDASGIEITLTKLYSTVSGQRTLDIRDSKIAGVRQLNVLSNDLILNSNSTVITLSENDPVSFDWDGVVFNGKLISNSANLELKGEVQIDSLEISGAVNFLNNYELGYLNVKAGSIVNLAENVTLSLPIEAIIESTPVNRTQIQSALSAHGKIEFNQYERVCFDNLIVHNVDIVGEAIVSSGLGSELTNSTGWVQDACENILLPKFTVRYPCSGALMELIDESEGPIETRAWQVDNGFLWGSDGTMGYAMINQTGFTNILLTVGNANGSKSLSKTIEVLNNPIQENEITTNGSYLISRNIANGYQWFSNNEKIPGATERYLEYAGLEGVINVVTTQSPCNKLSSGFVITGMEEETTLISPNPTAGRVKISCPAELNLAIANSLGQVVFEKRVNNDEQIDISEFADGIYFFSFKSKGNRYIKKVFLRKSSEN